MTAPAPRRRTRRERRSAAFFGWSSLLLSAIIVVGAVAVWPISRHPVLLTVVAAAIVLGHLIVLAAIRWGWGLWRTSAVTIGVYLVAALPASAPGMLTGLDDIGRGLVGVLAAPVTGWKNLLTLELPVGDYQTVLALVFFLFLVVTVLMLSLAWRSQSAWPLAGAVALVPTVFGVIFGSSLLRAAPAWVAGAPAGSVELAIGAAALLLALGHTVWRSRYERRRALRIAADASGVRSSGGGRSVMLGRTVIAASMLAIAAVVAGAVAPASLAGQNREVLRTAVDPREEISQTLSPLMQLRAFQADELYDRVLFTVSATGPLTRIRLATLPEYDGVSARVIDPASATDSAFLRVPSTLQAPAGTTPVELTVEIVDYEGIWVPLGGSVTGISFEGDRATALADAFFYQREGGMGVDLAEPGLAAGQRYVQQGAVSGGVPAVAQLTATRQGPTLPEEIVPESLVDWIDQQDAPAGGPGLAMLIERLRARGFLSHAVTVPEGAAPAWITALGDYSFQSSRAGHSTDRIDRLFRALNEKQSEVGGDDDRMLVAGVGDDEQFAVAAMMIADQLGFDARVVVGVRLESDEPGLPACSGGACRGGDVSAWVEVQDAGGAWVPIDVTPQHAIAMAADPEIRQDPKNATELHDEVAEQVPPVRALPTDAVTNSDEPEEPASDGAIWAVVRIAAMSLLALLVLLSPVLAVLLAKALRRGARRKGAEPARFAGGWEEFIDAAVDLGHPIPGTQTRRELAMLYAAPGMDSPEGAGGPQALLLADWADRAVFDELPPPPGASEQFWEIVDAERARLAEGRGIWARLRARLSLRSFKRRAAARRAARRGR